MKVVFYFKLILVILWFLIAYFLGAMLCFFRWGNRKNFKVATELASWGVLKIIGIRVVYLQKHFLDQAPPLVFMGKHQSMLDVMTYGSYVPNDVTLVVKKEIQWVPIFNLLMWGSNQLFIDRKNREDSIARLSKISRYMKTNQVSVAIAPEGTRNVQGDGFLPFKKGGFHLAIDAQAAIVPVVCAPLKRLYHYPSKHIRPGTLYIKVVDPIPTTGLTKNDVNDLMEKTQDAMIKAYEEVSQLDPFSKPDHTSPRD